MIAAAEFLLSQQKLEQHEVHLHFDACAVGFGSIGQQNVIKQHNEGSQRQRSARVMLSLVQQKFASVSGCHVHAHQGHPWNEMADSLACMVNKGWRPINRAVLRSGDFLKHQLRDWAWIQINPTAELPCLERILRNEQPHGFEGKIDQALINRHNTEAGQKWNSQLNFATVNVGTLEQDNPMPGTSITFKTAELIRLFKDKKFHFVAIQESRARQTCHKTFGDFNCFVSQGTDGQAGVELWLNRKEIGHAFKSDFQPSQDCCAWYTTSRILAVHCDLGSLQIQIVVVYGPQKGLSEHVIQQWWDELAHVLKRIPVGMPCFLMGDMNCRLGSVESDMIGHVGADFEDAAGERLRDLCNQHRMLAPATMPEYHQGPSWTHTGVNGARNRLDFILVSAACRESIKSSFVDYEVDVLNGDKDHQVVVLQMELSLRSGRREGFQRKPIYDRAAAREYKQNKGISLLADFPVQSWECDLNEHWTEMREHVQQKCQKWFPRPKRVQRQLYFSEKAWNLVCRRKDLRIEHRNMQRGRTLCQLRFFFRLWKNGEVHKGDLDSYELQNHLMLMQEAVVLEARRATDAAFRVLKRKEWKEWVCRQLNETISQMQNAKAAEIYKILRPRRICDKKLGNKRRPLPGLQDAEGVWRKSKNDVAVAWEKQFSGIENADPIPFEQLMCKSTASCQVLTDQQLSEIPTLYQLEHAIRGLHDQKAAGADGIGAEVWQTQVAEVARRVYALFLKGAVRRQAIVEHTGGWLLPLYKGKGSPCKMSGYRAILLEPTLGRMFSKTWRQSLVEGLAATATPMQWGGRRGLGIEPLHLQVRLWQDNAKHSKQSLGILFLDLRQAFYTVVKGMIACGDNSDEAIAKIFAKLNLPPSAFYEFASNVINGNLVAAATKSTLVADNISANLAHTWFAVPSGNGIWAPQTGSRPGDPCADILFSFVMSKVLHEVSKQAAERGIPLMKQAAAGEVPMMVTWVDDAAIAVQDSATDVVDKVVEMIAIVQDAMTVHGLQLSFGQGKTAVLIDFRGPQAVVARQACENTHGQNLQVLSEHQGIVQVPIVSHYKHLGGQIVRGGTKLPEINIRAAASRQNIAPLMKIIKNKEIPKAQKSMLIRSLALSVLRLHSGTWHAINQGEAKAWMAAVFRLYQMAEGRSANGEVEHWELYQLAGILKLPMPIEMLYIERLRIFVQILNAYDQYAIAAVIHNHHVAGQESWLHGLIQAVKWAQAQIGVEEIPDEMLDLAEWQCWKDFRECAAEIKKKIKKIEHAHILKVQTYCALKDHATYQEGICRDMGWTCEVDLKRPFHEEQQARCEECNQTFVSFAALATHQQRKHGHRMAIRRFVKDGTCRACQKCFHTRGRLLRHLQWSGTKCWIYHMRVFQPMSCQQAQDQDQGDMERGVALHQKGLESAVIDKQWRWATDDEMKPILAVTGWRGDHKAEPTMEELKAWMVLGALPPGQGGHPKTARALQEWTVPNVSRDVAKLEQQMLENVQKWNPCFDWIPRPLATGEKFFLILYSGHRRCGDIASWLQWDGRVRPIAVDVAVDKEAGDIMNGDLWIRLIKSRRVVGGHAGPPCETYTSARWNQIEGEVCPRPLRDSLQPWGRDFLTLREGFQVSNGTALMLMALRLLLTIFIHGGSISLERPRGNQTDIRQWSIWQSAFVRWLLLDGQIQTVTFLQGPLGQKFAKPTTMMVGRLANFAHRIFASYDKTWRPTEVLGGREGRAWKTAKGKIYPTRLSMVIAQSHLDHFAEAPVSGDEPLPEGLDWVLQRLAAPFDAYSGMEGQMQSDYHFRRG